ncbi:MAG: Sua5/YciO/YrdC/YwlC family protein [Dehalococcoidia bacterium]
MVDATALAALARDLSPLALLLAAGFWPGPLTLVVEAAPGLAPAVTGGLATVAVRAPDHPVAQALLRAFGGLVAAPSANRSGRPSPTAPPTCSPTSTATSRRCSTADPPTSA